MTGKEKEQAKLLHSEDAQKRLMLDALWKLDDKIKGSAILIGWLVGIVGIILLILNADWFYELLWEMDVDFMVLNAMISVVRFMGLVLTLASYPAYKCVLNAQRKKYATQILQLADKFMNN